MSRPLAVFDPFSPAFRADPYRQYDLYRAHDPVHWGRSASAGRDGTWYLTRYRDVSALLRDPRFGRESRRAGPGPTAPPPAEIKPLLDLTSRQMLFRDPPEHTRLRLLVSKAFTPSAVEELRDRLETTAHELLKHVLVRGTMDVIADYAVPMAVSVIATLIGMPRDCHGLLREWSNTFAAAVDIRPCAAIGARMSTVIAAMSRSMHDLVARARANPKDDLLSALVAAEGEGERLTEDEVVAMCCLLLISGNETVVNLVGNGMLALLRHPNELERLRNNPGLLPTAIEEFLRFESPVQMTSRYANEDVEIAGKRIRRGDSVCLALAAANRDAERFRNPNSLDVGRTDNRHLSFGAGIHVCLGAHLARLEAQIAFEVLLQRLRDIRLTGEVEWRDLIAFRGLRGLSVAFSPA